MAELALDVDRALAVLEQERGEGVAQAVGREVQGRSARFRSRMKTPRTLPLLSMVPAVVQNTHAGISRQLWRSVSALRSVWRWRSTALSCRLMSIVRPCPLLGVSIMPVIPRSGSRKVNGYVKAVLALEAVRRKREERYERVARSIASATRSRSRSRRACGR